MKRRSSLILISTDLLTGSNRQFPYALSALPGYLRSEWDKPFFRPYREAFPEDVRDTPEQLMAYVRELSEKDIKVGCLKQLQGQWLHFLFNYHVSANIGSAYAFLFIYHVRCAVLFSHSPLASHHCPRLRRRHPINCVTYH